MKQKGFQIMILVTVALFLASFVMLFTSPAFAAVHMPDDAARSEVLWQGDSGIQSVPDSAAGSRDQGGISPRAELPYEDGEAGRDERIPFSSLLTPGRPMTAEEYSDLLDFVADFNTYFYGFTDTSSLDDIELSAYLADYYLFSYRYHAARGNTPFYIPAAQRGNEFLQQDENALSYGVEKEYILSLSQSLFGRTLDVVNDRDLAGYQNQALVFPSTLDKHLGYLADVKTVVQTGEIVTVQYDLYANSYLNEEGISDFIPTSAEFILRFDTLSTKVRRLASGEISFRLLPDGGVRVIGNQVSEEENPQHFSQCVV